MEGYIAEARRLPPKTMEMMHKSLNLLERVAGIEPATYSLGSCRSTTELHPQAISFRLTALFARWASLDLVSEGAFSEE